MSMHTTLNADAPELLLST